MLNVLLIDAGDSPASCDSRIIEFSPPGFLPEPLPGGDHPRKSSELFLHWMQELHAGELRLIFVDYRRIPRCTSLSGLVSEIETMHGAIQIICHPYSASAPDDPHRPGPGDAMYLAPGPARPRRAIEIASIGHDGRDRGRVPGIHAGIIAVGMCDVDGRPMRDSGSLGEGKPDIHAPVAFALPDGGTYKGTSAGVCFSAAVAASALRIASESGCPIPHEDFARLGLCVLSFEGLLQAPHPEIIRSRLQALARFSTKGRFEAAATDVARLDLSPGCDRIHVYACPSAQNSIPRFETRFSVLAGGTEATASGFLSIPLGGARSHEPGMTINAIDPGSYSYLIEHGQAVASHRELQPRLPPKPLTIVGISASHDASACVIRDGKLVRAIQLERISRRKHDGAPYLHDEGAIRYCLDSLGVRASDVDRFAFNIQPLVPGYYGLSQPSHSTRFRLFDPWSERTVYVSHHLAHAFSGYSLSGFPRAIVTVADGSGGTVAGGEDLLLTGSELLAYLAAGDPAPSPGQLHVLSIYRFDEDGYELLQRDHAPSFNIRCGSSSLGETYAATANYIFGSMHASGKVMGLAPYGNAESMESLLRERNGKLAFSSAWKNLYRDVTVSGDKWKQYADLCARLQADFETALLTRLEPVIRKHGLDLVHAGGLALNCVANARLAAASPGRFFVPPAAADCGISVGCAYAADYMVRRKIHSEAMRHDYWGHPYGKSDILAAKAASRSWFSWRDTSIEELARQIGAGEIVGWFDGAAEFGPRALGHRSILADPRTTDSWTRINRDVKYREDFRPFAPVVCEDDAERFFHLAQPLPFMTQTCRVRSQFRDRLRAVTHVDGTARVQTLARETNPMLYDLLKAFGRLTGMPVLLNTSMNVQGQPIAESPSDALKVLSVAKLDGIFFPQVELTARCNHKGMAAAQNGTRFRLSFGVRLCADSTHVGTWFGLRLAFRDREEIRLSQEQFVFLQILAGFGRTLDDALSGFDPHVRTSLRTLVLDLVDKRYLLAASDDGANRDAADQRTGGAIDD